MLKIREREIQMGNRNRFFKLVFCFILSSILNIIGQTSDSTVTDYDGNVYNTIVIGEQTWLKENLKSLHYFDGTAIPDVVAYNNNNNLANIYGRLYTWDDAMRDAKAESVQGVCPCGFHIPSDKEWKELENYLGGPNIAGGKMKETGTAHWKLPNTGANNSSGLTILPGGEYDALSSPPKFALIKDYAVFWTSTEINSVKARERYLSYKDAKSSSFDWYKSLKYSIRCVKDSVIKSSDAVIKIHYLGHASFVLQFDNGITIVTDYGHYNAWINWGWDSPIHNFGDLAPNVMTFSHNHEDHYDPDRIPDGVAHILTDLDSLTIDGIEIIPIRTCENNINVESNTSFIFKYKGLKICHLGDAQAQIMNIDQNEELRNHITTIFPDTFDLLFMTIEGKQKFIPQAEAFINLLKPKRVIPMHHWSQKYRQDFLSFLETENHSGKAYQILQTDNAKYILDGSESVDSIKVLSLKCAAYSQTTDVGFDISKPAQFQLSQNHPNPFNPTTSIKFYLPAAEYVKLQIYNTTGKLINTLINEKKAGGQYNVKWNGKNNSGNIVSSGIYVYKMETKSFSLSKKMAFIK